MIQFILPAAIIISRVVVKNAIDEGVSGGVSKAVNEVDKRLNKTLESTIYNIVSNIILLSFAVYICPYFFNKSQTIYIICSIYLASIAHATFNIIKNIGLFLKFVFIYHFNIKRYIKEEIYQEAYYEAGRKIDALNFMESILNKLWGSSQAEIAQQISNEATRYIFNKFTRLFISIIILFVAYFIIFRLIVAPIIIKDATQLNPLEAVIYPAVFAIDYFFKTNLTALVYSAS